MPTGQGTDSNLPRPARPIHNRLDLGFRDTELVGLILWIVHYLFLVKPPSFPHQYFSLHAPRQANAFGGQEKRLSHVVRYLLNTFGA